MNRRGLLAAAVALAVAPFAAVATRRDDAPYLQGLIDAGVAIIGGSFTIKSPLVIRGKCAFMRDASIVGSFPGALIYVRQGTLDAVGCELRNDHGRGHVVDARVYSVVRLMSADIRSGAGISLAGEAARPPNFSVQQTATEHGTYWRLSGEAENSGL